MGMSALEGGMVLDQAPAMVHRRIAPDHYLLRLKSPAAARRARPGQFVHILCEGGGYYPLLRRPLSIFDADPQTGTFDVIYKVVGLGTSALAQVPAGAKVDFLGPLGQPFRLPASARTVWLVGGGVGIPPLFFLAKSLVKSGRPVRVEAFLGARTRGWVICAVDFRRIGVPVQAATDDGTLGHQGSVVDLWEQSLHRAGIASPPSGTRNDGVAVVCGPTPMMAAAARLAHRRRVPALVSLEERMGCAMGCCMGCVVEVATEPAHSHARFQRVCTEGPVFPAESILWS